MVDDPVRDSRPWPTPPFGHRYGTFVRRGRGATLADVLDRLAEGLGDRPAIFWDADIDTPVLPGPVISHRQFRDAAARTADALAGLGIGPGDRVVLWAGARPDFHSTALGLMRLGAVPVPVHFMFKAPEVDYIVGHSDASAVITDGATLAGAPGATQAISSPLWLSLDRTTPEGVLALPDLVAAADPARPPRQPGSLDEPVVILYTSGTTGRPKGAVIAHRNYRHDLQRALRRLGVRGPSDAVGLHHVPPAPVAGFTGFILRLVAGSPMIYYPRFDAHAVVRAISTYEVPASGGVPAMLVKMLDAGLDERTARSVKVWIAGADALRPDVARKLRTLGGLRIGPVRVPPAILISYGQAECGVVIFSHLNLVRYRSNCIGRPKAGIEHRVVDDHDRDVPEGETGELVIRGDQVTREYWRDPPATAEAWRGGWFHTGDLVRRQGRRLYFVDRQKDLIKSGGYSIFAGEVEEAMREHPAIEQVAVVGVDHAEKGQMPVAVVTLRPDGDADEAAILDWARSRLAAYKCPRAVVRVEEMPYTSSMKIRKRDLAEQLTRLPGIGTETVTGPG